MSRKVFISYRRDTTKYQARQIFAALREVMLPEHVFMDIDSIPLGEDFREILKSWVAECDVMLALIGPDWAETVEPNTTRRRLDNPSDFVRIEVGAALTRGIPVVPILLDRASLPERSSLPRDLKKLVDRQAEFIEFRTFDNDVARLIARLGLTADGNRPSSRRPSPAPAASPPQPQQRPAETTPEHRPAGVAPEASTEIRIAAGPGRPPETPPASGLPEIAPDPPPAPLSASTPMTVEEVLQPGLAATANDGQPAAPQAAPRLPAAGGKPAIIVATIIALLALPFSMLVANGFYGIRWNLVASENPYRGSEATGALFAALLVAGLFAIQFRRRAGGTALALYWLALTQSVLTAAIVTGMTLGWNIAGVENPSRDSLSGSLAGAVLVAGSLLAIIARNGAPTPTAVAVFWMGIMGTTGTLLLGWFHALGADWIHPATGGDGAALTGVLVAVVLVFATAFAIVRRRRGSATAGELWIYSVSGGLAALAAAFPIYGLIYPGSGPSSEPYYVILSLVFSLALALAWAFYLRRIRGGSVAGEP